MARKVKEYTVAEAAEILGVSPRTVRNYIMYGKLDSWMTCEGKSQYLIEKQVLMEFKKARDTAQKAAQKAREKKAKEQAKKARKGGK